VVIVEVVLIVVIVGIFAVMFLLVPALKKRGSRR